MCTVLSFIGTAKSQAEVREQAKNNESLLGFWNLGEGSVVDMPAFMQEAALESTLMSRGKSVMGL